MSAPRSTEELRAIVDPAARSRAVQRYVDRVNEKLREAQQLRRDAIAELLEANERRDWNRPAVIAKACEVSVSTVKSVRYELERSSTATR